MVIKCCMGLFGAMTALLVTTLILWGIFTPSLLYQSVAAYMVFGAFGSLLLTLLLGFFVPVDAPKAGDWY